ncbi:hypothetical protein Poly51_23800 [Rubripirellula tenax]|uniref:Uncharacterized protein n=1 Tax=Rubripirellula tenax TaxID=2528015 RepID=A0A5C6FA61_9BACT|nr:hypothetical protein Poly51_23800 [Rubripirellula tenax]
MLEAEQAYVQFKSLKSIHTFQGSARVFDLHAAIDHGVDLKPTQFSFKQIYTSRPPTGKQ